MKVQVVIPAAGLGLRLKTIRPKPFVLLNGKPIISYTLDVFQKSPLIDSVIVAANEKNISDFKGLIKQYRLTKIKKIIVGGSTRRESVFKGLKNLDHDTDVVVIHDGARPFVTLVLVEQVVGALKKNKAAVVAVPVKSTIKKVNGRTMTAKETLDRRILWEIQTPQVFKKDVILKAHKEVKDKDPSDDALLVEKLGVKVKIVMGDYKNIKITTEDDLIFAKALIALPVI